MLLEVDGLAAGYGRVRIVEDIALTVAAGEFVSIIGPNGAGKSTVLRSIAGQLPPMAGRVLFDGQDVTGWSCAKKATAGLIFVPQGLNIFPQMTLKENLELSAWHLLGTPALRSRMTAIYDSYPWIAARRDEKAATLSGGQRQTLALARVALTGPRLALLDEPSLGLQPSIVDDVFARIGALNQDGIAFLVVEQNARKALASSDRGYVFEQGRNRLTGKGDDLIDDPDVRKLYLGG